jgi:hypothetical protein
MNPNVSEFGTAAVLGFAALTSNLCSAVEENVPDKTKTALKLRQLFACQFEPAARIPPFGA